MERQPLGTLISVGSGGVGENSSGVEYYNPDSNTWSKLLNIDAGKWDYKSVLLDGKLILVGGRNSRGVTHEVHSYDFNTGTITQLASMSQPRSGVGAAVVSRHLFAMGGTSDRILYLVERYNPINNTWVQMPDMPTSRNNCVTTVLDGEIYAIGGSRYENLSVVEAFNPITGIWKQCAPMIEIKTSPAVATIGTYIYAVGGDSDGGYSNVAIRYDSLVNRWTYIQTVSIPRARGEGVNFNDSMIVAGGYSDLNVLTNLVESYDVKTNKWTTLAPLITARAYFALIEVPWKILRQAATAQEEK